jgi:hypothetical protein
MQELMFLMVLSELADKIHTPVSHYKEANVLRIAAIIAQSFADGVLQASATVRTSLIC